MQMIEGIAQIGEILMAGDQSRYLDFLVKDLKAEVKNKKQHVAIMDFSSTGDQLKFYEEEIDDQTAHKYLWIGNAKGSDTQKRLSSDNLSYLVSQSISSLKDELNEDWELWKKLDCIINNYFLDLGDIPGQQRRYRYVLDIVKCGINTEMNLYQQREMVQNEDISAKDVAQIVSDETQKYIESQRQLGDSEIGLYTVFLDGENLAQSTDYKNFLMQENLLPDFDDTYQAKCFVCHNESNLSYDVAKLKFKYYIKDKISFSSRFEKDFSKNFSFCKPCYMYLSAGENFIQNKMKTAMGRFQVYVIPKFLFNVKMSSEDIDGFGDYVIFSFNAAKNFKGMNKFNGLLQSYLKYQESYKNSYTLNFLFYQENNSEFRILRCVKDVNPIRLRTLTKTTNDIGIIGKKLLRESNSWNIDLGKIYFLTPIRISKGAPKAYKDLLVLYSNILSGGEVSYYSMIRQFTELIRIYKFEKFSIFNINTEGNPLWEMSMAVMECNLFMLYLRKLELLKGGKYMSEVDLKSIGLDDDRMQEFVTEMGYDDTRTAMFLMGNLIREIGYRQGGKEPILEKLNYQGIDARRLLRLTNEIFEKLKQYKVLKYNKSIFSAFKRLLDLYINDWPLDDQENVFYILSGYSYRRQRAKGESVNETEEEQEEYDPQ
ncbi:TIGR02556 family CRISPR-associated protein [Candidatus Poribacteria bacterium]|nr:TIGR02556 family CRISPR-associated protein [Candidatus Poribacteria bacterium]